MTDEDEVENDLLWPQHRCQGQSVAEVECHYNVGELRSDQWGQQFMDTKIYCWAFNRS